LGKNRDKSTKQERTDQREDDGLQRWENTYWIVGLLEEGVCKNLCWMSKTNQEKTGKKSRNCIFCSFG